MENVATRLFIDLIPKYEFKTSLVKAVYPWCKNKNVYKIITKIVADIYGQKFPYPVITCKVTYNDCRVEDYAFIQTIEF